MSNSAARSCLGRHAYCAPICLAEFQTRWPTGAALGPTPRRLKMANGTVKWFNITKGYGFIAPNDGGKDVFVHASAVERSELNSLVEGQTIAFEVARDRRTGKESAVDLKSA